MQEHSLSADQQQRQGKRLLHAALQAERKFVQSFLAKIAEEILSPVQEAWLDAASPCRPWWPDWCVACLYMHSCVYENCAQGTNEITMVAITKIYKHEEHQGAMRSSMEKIP